MAIKINFVLFQRTFKVIYEDPSQLFRTLLGFRNVLTKKSVQSGILIGIIIDLINWVFDDVISKELDSVPKYHILEPTWPRSSVGRALGYTARNLTGLSQTVDFTGLRQVVNKSRRVCWFRQAVTGLREQVCRKLLTTGP